MGRAEQTNERPKGRAVPRALAASTAVLASSLIGLAATALTGEPMIAWAAFGICLVVGLPALWMLRGGRYVEGRSGVLMTTRSFPESPDSEPISGRSSVPDIEEAIPASSPSSSALLSSSVETARTWGDTDDGEGAISADPATLTTETYVFIERLGRGSMGEVWRARHRRLGRECAVKVIRPDNVDWEDQQRFEREARVMAALSSPHTVQIHDFGVRNDGAFFYAMELLKGIDLQVLVERFGAMSPKRVVHVLRQACHSLEEAHGVGLVHRDLKPANLLLCRYGKDVDMLKVVDFGLAKEGESELNVRAVKLTKPRTVLGTAAYLAPESIKGSRLVDHRADLYALGCVAFWMLTKRLVFEEKNPVRMIHAHTSQAPPRLRTVMPEAPQVLDDLIDHCLRKKPEERPNDASEIRARLEQLSAEGYWTDTEARGWWAEHMPTG